MLGGQIASLFASVGIDTTQLQKGLGGANNSLLQFGKSLAKQVIGTVGLATAIYKLGKGVADSITDWADYADTMRVSAEMAGITTEEMSRLTQAADDFRVPMETMQRSMEMALKNGFVPTIDNIAALSDELLTIKDPAERAAKASEIFGKSYADMMPFLLAGGDAIREATGGISDNLIVTESAAQQAKEYKDQLDNLGDAWTGLRNILGKSLAPILTDVFADATEELTFFTLQTILAKTAIENFNNVDFGDFMSAMSLAIGISTDQEITIQDLTKAIRDMGGAFGESAQSIFDSSASFEQYSNSMTEAGYSLVYLTEEEWKNGKAARDAALANAEVGKAAEGSVPGVEALTDAEIAAAEAQAELNAEIANIKSLDANYKGIIDLAYEYSDILADQQDLQIERDKLISQGWSDQSAKVKDLDAQIAGLDDTMAELADRVTLDMFQATIAIGGVTETELDAYMQMAIDIGLMSEEGARAAMDAYGNAIATINSYEIDEKTGNVTVDAVAAFVTLDLLQQYQLLDKEQRVFVRTYYDTTPSNYDPYEDYTGPANLPPNPGQSNRATGGGVIGGTPYIVGERGPELFVPSTSGRIIPNDELGGRVINNYTLIMPTTANAGDVKTAFELMEAWA